MLAFSLLLPTFAQAGELELVVSRSAGTVNNQPLVVPDCANSTLKIAPCQRVAQSWVDHLNARAGAFVAGYRAAGFTDDVTSVTLDCSAGIIAKRKTRKGKRNSRHAYGEACDGKSVTVNGTTFQYRRAVTDEASPDRRFFTVMLDGWGDVGPGCIPEKGYVVMGFEFGCRPVLVDNCGVIDWRERGAQKPVRPAPITCRICLYTDPERAYE